MKQRIAELMIPIGDWLLELLMAVPMSVVRIVFLSIFALLVLWVIRMPAQYPDGTRKSILHDLRLYAIGVLVLQSLFYLIF